MPNMQEPTSAGERGYVADATRGSVRAGSRLRDEPSLVPAVGDKGHLSVR